MKKILSYILIVLTIGQIFAPFSLNLNSKEPLIKSSIVKAEENCEIENEYFNVGFPNSTEIDRPQEITYNVETKNCTNLLAIATVMASGEDVYGLPDFPIQRIISDKFSLTYHTGEKECTGGDCNEIKIRLSIINEQGDIIARNNESSQSLSYKCLTSGCEEPWKLNSASGTEGGIVSNCKITNVVFNPIISKPDLRPDNLSLVIGTSGCENKLITNLAITSIGSFGIDKIFELDRSQITSNSIFINLIPGEETCKGEDCDDLNVKFVLRDNATGQIIQPYYSHREDGADSLSYKCKKNGQIASCDDNLKWSLASSTGFNQNISSTTEVYYFEIKDKDGNITISNNFNKEEECKKVRDERAQMELKNNSGAEVSDCMTKTISQTTAGTPKETGDLPECSLIFPVRLGGCIAQGIYYLFFKTTSFFFGLAGSILDFTIMYSIDSQSYESTFVVEGWGVIRDFCNMFFIFVLLYIAFGTILGLNGVKTKEMIINVILIGLFINFSLFATQFIIDASNILTRIFYNQNTIVTGTATKDADGNIIKVNSDLGEFGEIKLSSAIVNKVDPQKLIIQAEKISSIPIRGTASNEEQETTSSGLSVGSFILVTLLAVMVNVVGMIAFASSALIFIVRVIGLWLAMIMAPLAFFSYIVPSMQSWKMVGWRNWWPETLKLAFLAPVFVFFMYIIVGFMDKGLGILSLATNDGASKSGLGFVVSVLVPFIFICVLLMKAKDIANDMSGEIGKQISNGISKYGGMAAGVALGVAGGGLAMGARATLGRAGAAMQNSEKLKQAEAKGGLMGFGARQLRNIGGAAGKGSMDIRGAKIAGKGLGDLGINAKMMGKPKEGGYVKSFNDKVAAKQKRAEELQVGRGEPLQKALNKTEDDLQALLSANKAELDGIDKAIEKARANLKDAKSTGNTHDETIYSSQLEAYKSQRKALVNGENMSGMNVQYYDENMNVKYIKDNYDNGGPSISQLEKEVKDRKNDIQEENRKRRWNYADSRERRGGPANREAAHRIRMESKLDSGEKGK